MATLATQQRTIYPSSGATGFVYRAVMKMFNI